MRRRIRIRLTGFACALLILAVAVTFISVNAVIDARTSSINARIALLKQDNEVLEDELRRLDAELKFIETREGIELYARAQGMGMAGETRYSAGN